MTYASNFPELSLEQSLHGDVEIFAPQTITVSSEAMGEARLLSQKVRTAEQWQAYHNAIALFGVQQWLAERGIDIESSIRSCSVYNDAIAGLLSGVCHLQVNGFKMCIVPIGSLTAEEIAVPRATLELAEYVPHLFIGVEVREELAEHQVRLWGSLRIDSIKAYLQQAQNTHQPELATDKNWTYRIPKHWFNTDTDTLLLHLRCLAVEAIALAPVMPTPSTDATVIQANLAVLRSRLESSQRDLWKFIPWHQAATLLTHPSLATALLQSTPDAVSERSIAAQAINVGQWLQGQLDTMAESLNWQLLPSFAPGLRGASPFRDMQVSMDQFEHVISTLTFQGITIPTDARGSYLDLPVGQDQVRLYIVAWDSSVTDPALPTLQPSPSEWSFLAVLGSSPHQPLSSSITLQVWDENDVLDHQTLPQPTADTYLFSVVSGTWDEKFWITLGVGCEDSFTLPPFTFQP
ncbi:MAG: DUF1822 family protein [Merismopedia sp. SIO2A8]|nr:DUF1822 family protein [Merismopedia sp. SIO2A8]